MNKDFEDIKISKKLENEYKTLIHQDVPDLWSRIEAGLETKEQSQNAVIDSSFTNNNISNQKVVKFKRKYKMWGTVGASDNIIVASWEAIKDAVEYRLQD